MNYKNFELRRASLSDAFTISALSVQVFLDTYATEGISPDLASEAFSEYSTALFTQRLGEASRSFILAESSAGLLGYAEVLLSPRVAPAGQLSGAELVRLYVQPAAQHKGIGQALLARIEQLAFMARSQTLWLTAWNGNVNARAFYARMGYADIGATTYSFHNNIYANRVFAKHLPNEVGSQAPVNPQ